MWNPVAPRNLLVAELIVYATIDYQDDQSEPLCICLATMILFYFTDL